MTPDAAMSVIEKEVMLSYLGTTIGMISLKDGEVIETICFVAGAPMPYRICAAILMFRLYGFDLNPPENALKETMQKMWSQVRLPATIREMALRAHPLLVARTLVERVLLTHLSDPDAETRKLKLIEFIDDIETRYAESLDEPLLIDDLQRLMPDDSEAQTVFDVARDIYFSITSFARA